VIAVSLSGADTVAARLESARARLPQRLGAVMERLGVALAGAVVNALDGGVLKRRSGRLAAAQTVIVTKDAAGASVAVGFDPAAVPYGAVQEFGGTTRAHLIAAKSGRALAFNVRGQLVFARRVNHPGSRIPAHSFLGASLGSLAPAATAETRAAVMETLDA
jgi:phage gpG-like protein